MTLETKIAKLMLYLERYQPKSLIAIENNLSVAQTKIIALLSENLTQRQIRKQIRDILQEAFLSFDADTKEDIEIVSEITYNKIGSIMAGGFVSTELAYKFKNFKDAKEITRKNLLDPNRLILGNTLDDMKNQMILGANNKLRATILNGLDSGDGIDKISKEVKAVVNNLSKNQARTVTRTILLNTLEDAKNESLKEFEDEIDYWVYSSVLDSRTSPYCINAHGYKTKDKSKAKYRPKTHWNCRSMWIIENELTRKLDRDATQNLVQWDGKKVNHRDGTKSTKFKTGSVKKIPRTVKSVNVFEYLDDEYKLGYLGKTRYKLYKDGKASFRELVDISRNRLMPISEIFKRI